MRLGSEEIGGYYVLVPGGAGFCVLEGAWFPGGELLLASMLQVCFVIGSSILLVPQNYWKVVVLQRGLLGQVLMEPSGSSADMHSLSI